MRSSALPIRDLRACRDRIADALVAVGVAGRIIAGECPIDILPDDARRGALRDAEDALAQARRELAAAERTVRVMREDGT